MEGQTSGEGLLCFAIRASVETVGETPVGVWWPLAPVRQRGYRTLY